MLKKLLSLFKSSEKDATGLMTRSAKRELESQIRSLLETEVAARGGMALLKPEAHLVVTANGLSLTFGPLERAIASVRVCELNTMRVFVLVREGEAPITQDMVSLIANDATRTLSRQIDALESDRKA